MRLLVSGGTGSFGQYATQVFLEKSEDVEIVVFSRDEEKQLEMKVRFNDERLKFVVGNVRDYEAMREATKNVDLIFHAAALKQIPICEAHPLESIKTNLLGTINVKTAAIANHVAKSVFLSTDKAVNPVNVYGACKMLAERVWNTTSTKEQFCSVRYGNILGSRGSVIPLFKQQIIDKKPLTLTHPDMTRFFITLKNAMRMVCHATLNMTGGEVYVPKLKSCRILDLARLISPDNYPIEYVGVRAGEKTHETLISEDEWRRTEDKGNHYVIHPSDTYDSGAVGESYNSLNAERLTETELWSMLAE